MENITRGILVNRIKNCPAYEVRKIFSLFKENRKVLSATYKNLEEALKLTKGKDFTILKKAFAKYDLIKPYKYSAYFKIEVEDNLENVLEQFTDKKGEVMTLLEEQFIPKRYHNILKINIHLIGSEIRNGTPARIDTKYPILVIFHEINDEYFVEISVDNVNLNFRNDEMNFFIHRIQAVFDWLKHTRGLSILPIDLLKTIDNLGKESLDEIKLSGQKMLIDGGAQATLDSGNSNELLLPILGELKNLINDNLEMFDSSPDVKGLLEGFIQDIVEESELPWINITWDHIIKSRRITIKFTFSSQTSTEFTLLNYYSHESGREGMQNATNEILTRYCNEQHSIGIVEDENIA